MFARGLFAASLLFVTASLGPVSVARAVPPPVCGDGIVDQPCDDGNTIDGDGCSSDCLPEVCGDGIYQNNGIEPDEECDDANTVDGDGCDGDCTCGPCGDGVQCGSEECDDGNTVDGDGCDVACTCGPCGDGVQCGTEWCDDGNTIDDDDCRNNCLPRPTCGNGIVSDPEECDDGNTLDGDGCTALCKFEPYDPSAAERKCVLATNKSWAGVIRAANKVSGKCVRNLAKGRVTGSLTDCAVASDVSKAVKKTATSDQKNCAGKVGDEMFGYRGDPAAVNDAALVHTLVAHRDLLGVPDHIVASGDKADARCQKAVQKGLIKYLDALASDANEAKKKCLRGKVEAPCRHPGPLAAAMTTAGARGARALERWEEGVAKRCSDPSTLSTHFPGACAESATFAELVACAGLRSRCAFCASLEAADALAIDCPSFARPHPNLFACAPIRVLPIWNPGGSEGAESRDARSPTRNERERATE